jgi:hypothetical protein
MRALSWGAFGTAYLACFCLSTALDVPVFWYFPVEGRFELSARPEGLAADFFGRVGLCLVVATAVYFLARLVVRRLSAPSANRWIFSLGAWGAVLFLFTGALYGYKLYGRRSKPAPLPPHYVAR